MWFLLLLEKKKVTSIIFTKLTKCCHREALLPWKEWENKWEWTKKHENKSIWVSEWKNKYYKWKWDVETKTNVWQSCLKEDITVNWYMYVLRCLSIITKWISLYLEQFYHWYHWWSWIWLSQPLHLPGFWQVLRLSQMSVKQLEDRQVLLQKRNSWRNSISLRILAVIHKKTLRNF